MTPSLRSPYLALTSDFNPIVGYEAGMRIVARSLVLLPLLWVEDVWAANCASTDYELTDQTEVDALGATGCDRVSGYLHITKSPDITNLDVRQRDSWRHTGPRKS